MWVVQEIQCVSIYREMFARCAYILLALVNEDSKLKMLA